MRTRSGARNALPAFRRAAGDGTRLDFIHSGADGFTGTRHLVQGQTRPRYVRERWTLQLPDPHGSGHLDLRQRCGARG